MSRRDDRGSAAVVMVAAVALVMVLAAGLGAVAVLWQARSQASAAADAAALAAAPVTFRPYGAEGSPAAEAARFAAANGTRLYECRCPIDRSWAARTVVVTVVRIAHLPGIGPVPVQASAAAEFRPAELIRE